MLFNRWPCSVRDKGKRGCHYCYRHDKLDPEDTCLPLYTVPFQNTCLADPVDVGAHASEDGGLLGHVAAKSRAKAHNTMNLPSSVIALAVQRATGVTLCHVKYSKRFEWN